MWKFAWTPLRQTANEQRRSLFLLIITRVVCCPFEGEEECFRAHKLRECELFFLIVSANSSNRLAIPAVYRKRGT